MDILHWWIFILTIEVLLTVGLQQRVGMRAAVSNKGAILAIMGNHGKGG